MTRERTEEPNSAKPEAPSSDRGSANARRSRFLSLLIGGGCALLALLVVAGVRAYGDLADARALETELEGRVAEAEERVADLELRIERIRNEPDALERVAREELGMLFPEEHVVLLPDPAAPTGEAAPVVAQDSER